MNGAEINENNKKRILATTLIFTFMRAVQGENTKL